MKHYSLKDVEEKLYEQKTFTEQILLLNDAVAELIQENRWLKEEIRLLREDVDWLEPPKRIGR
jgi:cell division protein FtsB